MSITPVPTRFRLNIILTLCLSFIIFTGCVQQPPPFEHQVEVIAADTEQPIPNADIRAEIGVRNAYEATTGTDGIATITIDAEHLEGWAKIIVTAEGYQRHSILAEMVENGSPSVVGLEPEASE